jgi:hypothetical protein
MMCPAKKDLKGVPAAKMWGKNGQLCDGAWSSLKVCSACRMKKVNEEKRGRTAS